MIDFPATPVAGQIFFAPNGVVYQYSTTYTSWVPVAPSSGQSGDFHAHNSAVIAAFGPGTAALVPNNILTGNLGGYYNAATGAYTPPAGRYLLMAGALCVSSAAGQAVIQFTKNGANIGAGRETGLGIVTVPGASYNTDPRATIIVDANGTDVFRSVLSTSVAFAANNYWFCAFPISGAQQLPGTGSSWRLISRTVISAPQASLNLQNIPADINDLELRFDLLPVSNDTGLFLKFYDGGGTLQSANYVFTTDASQTNMAGGVASAVMNSIALGSAVAGALSDTRATRGVNNTSLGGARGRATLNNIRDATRVKAYDFVANHLSGDATTWIAVTGSGLRNTTGTNISGLQLLFGTGNIASGVVSLWGSP